MRWMLYFSILFSCVFFAVIADARTIYVNGTTGANTNDGLAPNRAVATVQRGAEIVRGGDLMIVHAGVYYERPVFNNLGSTSDKPVWLLAQPRGSVTISGMWKEAALGRVKWKSEGSGVYSAAHKDLALFGSYNNTFLFRFNTEKDLRKGYVYTENSSTGRIKVKTPNYGFAPQNGRIYLKLPNGENPNGKPIRLSSPSYRDPNQKIVLKIRNSPYVTLDGFRIEGSGLRCVEIDHKSHHPTVRNTVFEYCKYGLRLPDNSLVEWSEHTYPGFRNFAKQVYDLNGKFRIYHLVKNYHVNAGFPGKFGNLYEGGLATTWNDKASRHCEFRYNFLHELFDGERLGSFEDSESHHSVYMYTYDNHIELEHWDSSRGSKNLRVHHSLFLAGHLGPISHQENGLKGPHYVYRNVIYGFDKHGWASYTQIKQKAPNATSGIFYYHNLIWGGNSELLREKQPGHEHFRFRNNIFIFSRNRNNQRKIDTDYNLLINNGDEPWLYGKNGKYIKKGHTALKFLDVDKLNFGIRAGSAAENAGVRLKGYNDDTVGRPDIGPFEVGENPGTDWPRPRKTTFISISPRGWTGSRPPVEHDSILNPPTQLRLVEKRSEQQP